MARTLIPADVVVKAMNLDKSQVAAAMDSGGAVVSLTEVKFQGMMPGGVFVYACEGTSWRRVWGPDQSFTLESEPWPSYLADFKIKLVRERDHDLNFHPEFQDMARRRMLSQEFILAWA